MTYKQFDVVVVPFPFTDRTATKKRPALVISHQKNRLLKFKRSNRHQLYFEATV